MGEKRHGNAVYDWGEWLSAPRTVLVRGTDYYCSQSSMATQIRNKASQRGVRVRLVDTGDSITIEVLGEVPRPNKAPVAR